MTALGELADVEFCYLTTTGRATGRRHRIEIWFVAHEAAAYLLANEATSDWHRNLLADPRVILEILGERHDTTAHPVAEADPAHAIVRPAMVAKYQATYLQEDLSEWSRTASLVRVGWPG